MKEIVKVLLAEGVDEETIHEVLDVIEEKMTDPENVKKVALGVLDKRNEEANKAYDNLSKVSTQPDGVTPIDPRRATQVQKYRMNITGAKYERAQDRLNRALELAGVDKDEYLKKNS